MARGAAAWAAFGRAGRAMFPHCSPRVHLGHASRPCGLPRLRVDRIPNLFMRLGGPVRSPSRRFAISAAVMLSVALLGAACSKAADNSATTGPGGSVAPAPKSGFDYSTLSGTLKGSGSSFQAPYEEA